MILWMDEKNDKMNEAAELCLKAEGIEPPLSDLLAVSISFVDETEIRDLNHRFRGVDSVTDVLSFPMMNSVDQIIEAAEAVACEESEVGEAAIGDVVICRNMIRRQAEEYGHSEQRELIYLFVHSMLHLLGYDHMEEEEKRLMRSKEDEIMNALGIERQL